MRKFSKVLILLILPVSVLNLDAQNGGISLKKKILTERFENEKEDVAYAVKVSKQEIEVIRSISYNALLKHRKLQLLKKSSVFLKERCFMFDNECRKIYNMSIVYLESAVRDSKKDMDELEKLFQESHDRLKKLEAKLEHLEKGIDIETFTAKGTSVIPELENVFACTSFGGWNTNRGVFVLPGSGISFPMQVFVKDVIKLDNSSSVIVFEAGDYTLTVSYVKTPNVKQGDIVQSGTKLFTGVTGNPVVPGTALMFIVKNGKFINPVFMCR